MTAAEEPMIQELGEDSDDGAVEDVDTSEVEGTVSEVPAPTASTDGATEADVAGMAGMMGKQNRNEKKARKAVAKLGLKAFPGVNRVAVRKSDGQIFAISNPEVMKAPGSDTYIVFGEATMDDQSQRMQQAAAAQFGGENMDLAKLQAQMAAMKSAGEAPPAAPAAAAAAAVTAAADDDDDEEVDTEGLAEADITLVMDQGKVSRNKAAKVLKANDGDVVNAIMEITMI